MELWAFLQQTHNIPPCPSASVLYPVKLPAPPLVYESSEMLVRLAQTAIRKKLGIDTPVLTNRDRIAKRKRLVHNVYEMLSSCEVPAAEWVARRIADYSVTSLGETIGFPPTSFMWSNELCSVYLAEPGALTGRVTQSIQFCESALALARRWHAGRRAIIKNPENVRVIAENMLVDIQTSIPKIQQQSEQMLATLKERVAEGEYVW